MVSQNFTILYKPSKKNKTIEKEPNPITEDRNSTLVSTENEKQENARQSRESRSVSNPSSSSVKENSNQSNTKTGGGYRTRLEDNEVAKRETECIFDIQDLNSNIYHNKSISVLLEAMQIMEDQIIGIEDSHLNYTLKKLKRYSYEELVGRITVSIHTNHCRVMAKPFIR